MNATDTDLLGILAILQMLMWAIIKDVLPCFVQAPTEDTLYNLINQNVQQSWKCISLDWSKFESVNTPEKIVPILDVL